MALSDSMAGGDKGSGKAPVVSLKVAPLDPVVAMNRFIKAVHDHDAEAAYSAYCLLHDAHEASEQGEPDGDGDEGY